MKLMFDFFKKPFHKKILVVSHERSGTHFLINTIAANFPGYSSRFINIYTKDLLTPCPQDQDNNKALIRQQIEGSFNKKIRRIFKSHHQALFFTEYLLDICGEYEVFYIVRDGRDVLTSQFYYFKNNQHLAHKPFPVEDNFSRYLQLIPGDFPHDGSLSLEKSENYVDRWAKHVQSWYAVSDKVTIIKYEKMIESLETVVQTIAERLNTHPPTQIINPSLWKNTVNPRKGIVGEHSTLFSPDDYSFFWKYAGATMQDAGYLADLP